MTLFRRRATDATPATDTFVRITRSRRNSPCSRSSIPEEQASENVAFRADDDDDDANEIAPIDRYVCPRMKLEFGRFWYNSA